MKKTTRKTRIAAKVTKAITRIRPASQESDIKNPSSVCSEAATIFYKKLPGDMILITGFENFFTANELKQRYGEGVAKIYFEYIDNMERIVSGSEEGDGIRVGIRVGKKPTLSLAFSISSGPNKIASNESNNVFVGDIYSKQDFSKLIARIKKCGELLHDIIAAVDKGQRKMITI